MPGGAESDDERNTKLDAKDPHRALNVDLQNIESGLVLPHRQHRAVSSVAVVPEVVTGKKSKKEKKEKSEKKKDVSSKVTLPLILLF